MVPSPLSFKQGVGVSAGTTVGVGVRRTQSCSPKQEVPKTTVQPLSHVPATGAAQRDGHWQQSLAPAVLVAVGVFVGLLVAVVVGVGVRTFTANVCVTNAKVAAV
jgi:hypothetical protein